MSNGNQGSASALPAVPSNNGSDELALADQWEADALAAIEAVQDPDDAEQLLRKVTAVEQAMRLSQISGDRERRWKGMRLKAEARYGELLPPPTTGGQRKGHVTGSHVEPGDRKAQQRARETADAKRTDPKAFKDYTEKDPNPSRAGLRRKVPKDPPKKKAKAETKEKPKEKPKRTRKSDRTIKGRESLSHDPAVYGWVRDRTRQGWTREQIVAASRAGTDGWPVPDESLSNGVVSEVRAAIAHVERIEFEALRAKLRKAKTPEARMRALDARRPPNSATLRNISSVVSKLVYHLDSINVEDYELEDLTIYALELLQEDLTYLGEWWDRTLRAVQGRLGEVPTTQTIEKLRMVTVANGATEGEQANAEKFAARLQRTLDNRLATR